MQKRIDQLREQIESMRAKLREGVSAPEAIVYLQRILEKEEELKRLTKVEELQER